MLTASTGHRFGSEGEVHRSGEQVGQLEGPGSLRCVGCGYALSLTALEELPSVEPVPTCPACGGTRFRRVSIFGQPTAPVGPLADLVSDEQPTWLDDLRDGLAPGPHLAFATEAGRPTAFALMNGWSRIGRSAAADLRLDDPTVSRRHALVVRTEAGELRALDDRSLNGLFVNGERVEWARLSDGDELAIGRYRIYVVEA